MWVKGGRGLVKTEFGKMGMESNTNNGSIE